MEQLIKHKFDVTSMPLYDCSSQNLTGEEYTKKYGEPRMILGIFDICYGIFIEILYFPCLAVMRKKENIQYSCFKIMFLLGIIDMCAIAINSIETGFLMIEGAVFCSHPVLIYISGAVGLGLWCAACLVCLILGMNRVFDILFPTLIKRYFAGHRTTLVLLLPIIYGMYFVFFTSPPLFTSKLQAWFFDPFIYEGKSEVYENYYHTANNLLVVISTCLLYGYFCTALSRYLQSRVESKKRRTQSQIFIQTTIICMSNFIASMVYVYMNFFPVPDVVVVGGYVAWQLGHGCPAIIYLCMNTTIRSGISSMFQSSKISHTSNIVSTNGKAQSNHVSTSASAY